MTLSPIFRTPEPALCAGSGVQKRKLGVRVVLGSIAVMFGLVATAPAALADAAGPTDYNTEIVSIEPNSAPIKVEMIGGDSFLSLEQLEPVEIIVLGYQAEPYLRFDTDGVVYENRRSPSTWLNQERYGSDRPPSFTDPKAPPEWFEVADNGRYAWHDHRSHWMNPERPPGAEAGDQVLEATVPIQIDGEQVTITVASFLLDDPSVLPAALGALASAGAGALLLRSGRLGRSLMALVVAAVAGTLGTIAYRSVPAETEPSQLLWLLPAVALGAALVQALARNHTATTVYLDGLAIAAGAALAAWGYFRFDALQRALIPSDAPAALDRFTIVLALVAGAAVAAIGLYGLIRPQRLQPIEH